MKEIKTAVLIVSALALIGLIFVFSSQEGAESNDLSVRVVDGIRDFSPVIQELNDNSFLRYINFNLFLRKFLHFSEFFVLYILAYHTLCGLGLKWGNASVIALISCIGYAVFDETHQFFIRGRTSNVMDVLIDTVGSVSALLLIRFVRKMRQKKSQVDMA